MAINTPKAKDPSALRPSASLVVVNSRNEVLLVHRNPKATSNAMADDSHLRYSLEEITTRDRTNRIE